MTRAAEVYPWWTRHAKGAPLVVVDATVRAFATEVAADA
jgi:hypothetical protein